MIYPTCDVLYYFGFDNKQKKSSRFYTEKNTILYSIGRFLGKSKNAITNNGPLTVGGDDIMKF